MEAVPSGELSSIIRILKGTFNEKMVLIIDSMFSFSFYVGMMTRLDIRDIKSLKYGNSNKKLQLTEILSNY